jgi:hypothetical protein
MGLGSGIRDPGSGKNLFRIPDPGVKKAPDPDPQYCPCLPRQLQPRLQHGGGGQLCPTQVGGTTVPPRLPCRLQPRLQHGGGRQLCLTQVGGTTVPPRLSRRLQPRLQHGGGRQLCPTQVNGTTPLDVCMVTTYGTGTGSPYLPYKRIIYLGSCLSCCKMFYAELVHQKKDISLKLFTFFYPCRNKGMCRFMYRIFVRETSDHIKSLLKNDLK